MIILTVPIVYEIFQSLNLPADNFLQSPIDEESPASILREMKGNNNNNNDISDNNNEDELEKGKNNDNSEMESENKGRNDFRGFMSRIAKYIKVEV